jgi:hypothetical protein
MKREVEEVERCVGHRVGQQGILGEDHADSDTAGRKLRGEKQEDCAGRVDGNASVAPAYPPRFECEERDRYEARSCRGRNQKIERRREERSQQRRCVYRRGKDFGVRPVGGRGEAEQQSRREYGKRESDDGKDVPGFGIRESGFGSLFWRVFRIPSRRSPIPCVAPVQ